LYAKNVKILIRIGIPLLGVYVFLYFIYLCIFYIENIIYHVLN